MSKQEFKDILEYGKCKCGNNAARKPHICPNGSMQVVWSQGGGTCTCCESCEEKCTRACEALNKVLKDIAKAATAHIDAEIVEGLKNEQR